MLEIFVVFPATLNVDPPKETAPVTLRVLSIFVAPPMDTLAVLILVVFVVLSTVNKFETLSELPRETSPPTFKVLLIFVSPPIDTRAVFILVVLVVLSTENKLSPPGVVTSNLGVSTSYELPGDPSLNVLLASMCLQSVGPNLKYIPVSW